MNIKEYVDDKTIKLDIFIHHSWQKQNDNNTNNKIITTLLEHLTKHDGGITHSWPKYTYYHKYQQIYQILPIQYAWEVHTKERLTITQRNNA